MFHLPQILIIIHHVIIIMGNAPKISEIGRVCTDTVRIGERKFHNHEEGEGGSYREFSIGWNVDVLPGGRGRAIEVEILARSVLGIRTYH